MQQGQKLIIELGFETDVPGTDYFPATSLNELKYHIQVTCTTLLSKHSSSKLHLKLKKKQQKTNK